MGRSQVERNRIKGRPGGRGRGGGGGGGRGGRSSRTSGPDPRTLGDNAFRYERTNRSKDTVLDDGSSDMLLDDFNTGLLLGSDYHGASHYELQEDDYDNNVSSFEKGDNDWMAVDVQALTKCLKQLPIHERLDIPYHVGRHIESRYGTDRAAGGKKTLAELREESKCIVNNETVDDEIDANNNSPEIKETKANDVDNNDGDDDDEDDLDAWLDDMIS